MDKNSALPRILTSRELLVVYLLAKGHADKDIAEKMNITVHTVRSYVHNILKKMDAKNRVNVVYKAMKSGMITESALITKSYD